jgi:chromosome segregation ATPase
MNLDEQMEGLWRKLQSNEPRPEASGDLPAELLSAERDLMLEMVRQMRHRFAQERLRWKALLDERDKMVASLKQNKALLENELAQRRQAQEEARVEERNDLELQSLEKAEWQAHFARQVRHFEEELNLREREIEDLKKARDLDAARHETQRKRWRHEEESWRGRLQKKDEEIAALQAQLQDALLQRRKDQSGFDEERRRLQEAHERDGRASEEKCRRLQDGLDTRTAELDSVQRLLQAAEAEIVALTRRRDQLESEAKMSSDQVRRLQSEISALRDAWETERAHWRELWDRERTSREKWYEQMREWEDTLYRESGGPRPGLSAKDPAA